MTPFQFGCGEEAPMTPESKEDPVEQLDPATEAAVQKKAMKENGSLVNVTSFDSLRI